MRSREDSIEYVKLRMRQEGEIHSYAHGNAGHVSMQFQGFVYLTETLSVDELIELQNDSSIVLQIYSYAALVHKRYRGVKQIELKLLADSTLVPVKLGGGGGRMYVWAIVKKLSRFYTRKDFNNILRDKYHQKKPWQNLLFRNL